MLLGSGSKLYCLYIPFTISPGIEISAIKTNRSYTFTILGYDFLIKKIFFNHHSLTISQFKTPEKARDFLPKAFSFLYWMSLKQGVGLTFPQYIKKMTHWKRK